MADTFTPGEFVASDGYRLGYRRYEPDGPVHGTVVFLHGIQSHAGWYDGTSEHLRRAGWRVLFLDRRGSGVNTVDRGDSPGYRRLLDDVGEFVLWPRGLGTGPVMLAGISWGGKLAAGLPARHPGLVDGVVLMCPGITPRVGPTFGQRLAIGLARVFTPGRRFPIPLSDPALFTASPSWQEYIANDPLSLREATARFLVSSLFLDRYLRRMRAALTLPTLLMLAGRDRIIDNDRLTRFFAPVAELPTAAWTTRLYPEAHHTLEFEPNPEEFRADLLAWLEAPSRRANPTPLK